MLDPICNVIRPYSKTSHKSHHKRIIINVSGTLFETYDTTLLNYPETLLGNFSILSKYYCERSGQYYFNRNRISFEAILFFYQSLGKLYRPPEVSVRIFEEECLFFKIPVENILAMKSNEGILLIEKIMSQLNSNDRYNSSLFQMKIWNFLENREATLSSKIFTTITFFFIFLSVISTVFETVDEFHSTMYQISPNFWHYMEIFLNSFFLLELIARVTFCPSKTEFFKSTLNWIDILVVIPFFITLPVTGNHRLLDDVLGLMKILRVLRTFRLSKQSPRMKVVGLIVLDSLQDLQLFFVCLLIIVIFGGSVMYYLEQNNENTQFYSIPESMWWAIQTFLTLGYGDIAPETALGKTMASIYMVFGVVTISLPVLSLIMKFISYASNKHM